MPNLSFQGSFSKVSSLRLLREPLLKRWLAGSGILLFGVLLFYTGSATLPAAIFFAAAMAGIAYPMEFMAAFLFFDALGHRDFTYMSIEVAGLPLFVGEWAILILLIPTVPKIRRMMQIHMDFLRPFIAFFSFSFLYYLLSLPGWSFLESTRNFALVYYSLFAVFILAHIKSNRDIRLLFSALIAGTLPNLAADITNFIFQTFPKTGEQENFSMRSSYFYLIGFGYLLPLLTARRQHRKAALGYVLTVTGVIFFFVYTKTAMVASMVSVLLLLILQPGKRSYLPAIIVVSILSLSLVIGTTQKKFPSVTVLSPSTYIYDSRFDLYAMALRDFTEHPYGIGFGANIFGKHVKESIPRLDELHSLHNSYITLLRRIGLIGFILFIWLVASTVSVFLKSRQIPPPDPSDSDLTLRTLLAWCGAAIYPLAHTALEGPFMGIPFWVLLGLVWVSARLPFHDPHHTGMRKKPAFQAAPFGADRM